MIVGVMRKLCVWVDCKNPEALAANASWPRSGGHFAYIGVNACVCRVRHTHALCFVWRNCAQWERKRTYHNLSDLLGRATALAVRISGLSNRLL